jgi:hypothetical protein
LVDNKSDRHALDLRAVLQFFESFWSERDYFRDAAKRLATGSFSGAAMGCFSFHPLHLYHNRRLIVQTFIQGFQASEAPIEFSET